MREKHKFWLAGLVLAGTGVLLVRVVIGMFDRAEFQLAIYFLGITLSLTGLGVIMYGIRKS